MRAMLLRVGIDQGTDGALAPIFEDGTFEYIPMSETDLQSNEDRTYENTIGRSGQPLSTFLPKQIAKRTMHFDPEFETCTYGDPTSKREYLLKLQKEDLLVFYAGLKPYRTTMYAKALYFIGYFTIREIVDFNCLLQKEIEDCYNVYSNNAHLKRSDYLENLVIAVGHRDQSKLLDKAILISQTKHDKNGKPYQAVSEEMEASLGITGSIQRSIPPRLISREESIVNLESILGR